MDKESIEKESTMEDIMEMFQDTVENPSQVMTFSDLENLDKSEDVVENLEVLHSVAHSMMYNIIDYSPDKVSDARKLLSEYYEMGNAILDEVEMKEITEDKRSMIDKVKGVVEKFKQRMSRRKRGSCKKEETIDIKKELGMMVWKSDDGIYRWFARYSNCYRDNDNPPEIISKASHKRFVELVDTKQVDYPELWHWHIPGTRWGKADWIAFDEENGIAMAAGYVDEGHEKEAELLASYDKQIAVSHGMPNPTIKRNSDDKSILDEHITKEISDLPLWAAANKLTSFEIVKENEMGIPDKKKEYLIAMGYSEEMISQIEKGNSGIAKEAEEAGLESKEAEVEQTEAPVETDHVMEAENAPEPVVAEAKEQNFVTSELLTEVVKQITETVGLALQGIREEISSIKSEVSEVKETKSKEAIEELPTASLAAMITKNLRGSAIGNEEAIVRKNSTLAKSGPDETPAQESSSIVNTGNPVIDNVITGIFRR